MKYRRLEFRACHQLEKRAFFGLARAFPCALRRTGLTPKRLAKQDFDAIASVGRSPFNDLLRRKITFIALLCRTFFFLYLAKIPAKAFFPPNDDTP